MKAKNQKRTDKNAYITVIIKALALTLVGAVISTASILGAKGAFLPAFAAFFAPVWAVPLLIGGAVIIIWNGVDASVAAFLAAAIICIVMRLLYNSKDKHKYPLSAAAICGFTVLSGNIAAVYTVGAGFGEYVMGTVIAALCGVAVFVYARLSSGTSNGRISLMERDKLIPAVVFAIAAFSSWEIVGINLGIAVYIVFSCCALYCLKRNDAAVFCAVLSLGFVISGEGVWLMGMVTAAAFIRPAYVNKNRRFAAVYLISSLMLLSLCLGETDWLRSVLSALVGTAVFSLLPEKSLGLFIGCKKTQLSSELQNTVSGRGTFLSAELERLAARVVMGEANQPESVEDAVYTKVCLNCERYGECFGDSDKLSLAGISGKKHFCAHFDDVMNLASQAQKNIERSFGEERKTLERRKIFSCALTAASEAAKEAGIGQTADSERIRAALDDAGVGCREVYFSDDGSCEMYYPAGGRVGKRRVSAAFGGLSGSRLDFGESKESGGMIRLTYLPKRHFAAEFSAFSIAKEEHSPTGDGVRSFEKGVYQYILLSDGMGTGSIAGEYSSFLLESLDGLIRASYSPETAILLASQGLMCSINDEGFATLNMVRLNLVSGDMDFYSCGEGTSFVFDGNKVISIPGGGYPLGVMDEPSVNRHSFNCNSSVLLIMLTDGGSFMSEARIGEVLNECGKGVLSEIAEAICDRAFAMQTDKTRDDVTVVAVNIEKL